MIIYLILNIMRINVIWIPILMQALTTQVMSACSAMASCDPRCDGSCAAENDINACCDCVESYQNVAGGPWITYYFWYLDNGTNGARCGISCESKHYKETNTNPNTCRLCADECQ